MRERGHRGEGLRRELIEGNMLIEREVEALEGAARGETSAQTGERLYLAEETIKHYRKTAIAKLAAPNVTRAVVICIGTGLLNIADLMEEPDE